MSADDAEADDAPLTDLEATETAKLAPSVPEDRARPSLFSHAVLLSVPILWGTFTPSMKLLLDNKHSPPVIVTNLLSHAVGTAALGLLWLVEALPRRRCIPEDTPERDALSSQRIQLATSELGLYLFFGQLTQLLGLGGTSATINAILVQSSVVIVPLFDRAAPKRLFARMLPSILALAGIFFITVAPNLLHDSGDGGRSASKGADSESPSTFGIVCSLASAIFYALHTIRLSEYGDVDATVQATGQVAVNTALDLLALLASALVTEHSENPMRWLRHAWRADDRTALHHLLEAACWNGLVVVGATTWGMSFAQRSFPASTAVLAYAMEPLFAALFAALFLYETIGTMQLVGGALIIGANMLIGFR